MLPAEPSAAPSGTLVARREIGDKPAFDARCATVLALNPRKAETVGDRAFFCVEVEGVSGNDGNALTLAPSERDTRQATHPVLRIEAVQPTVRVPDKRDVTPRAFTLPAGAETLTVRDFDAAAAAIRLETAFRGLPVAASGQNEWRDAVLAIPPEWRGGPAALTIARGDEMPNDVTVEVRDADGRTVPLQPPATRHVPNNRPVAAAVISPLATCRSVAFDASPSTDPDGDRLEITWDFGDGAAAEGKQARHRFNRSGVRVVRLRVDDGSNDPCGWAVAEREIVVNAPAVVEAGADQSIAVDATVRLDGGRSDDVDGRITGWTWDLGDGTSTSGQVVEHRSAAPGSYVVRLTVRDDAAVANSVSVNSARITVNAPPLADAGPDRQAAIGEVIAFEGSGSRDPDGQIVDYAREFGDGGAGEGIRTEYASRAPGTYTVCLSVRDDTGRSTSGGEAWAVVRVNAPPVAEAGR